MSDTNDNAGSISHSDLLELKRWNTPSIYNGWEQVTEQNAAVDGFNLEETRCFMPQMGPMIGYAVTIVCEPSRPEHSKKNPDGWDEYLSYVASVPGPKIVVVQDLDKPRAIGSFWGEVSSNIHRALGCVGTITDGAVRDVDEMCNAGFHAIVRRRCVGHAHSWPVRWNCTVEAFGRTVEPGAIIHADKHGFLVIPHEDVPQLLKATRFMDSNECRTLIPAARSAAGKSIDSLLAELREQLVQFRSNVQEQSGRGAEW
jgi:regulator of RNase E activity RraA